MSPLKENIAHGIEDPLTSRVVTFSMPLEQDDRKGWRPTRFFKGSTPNLQYLSCHASILNPGRSPHPPHRHEDEEILLILEGEADLLFPDEQNPGDVSRHHVVSGMLVYLPAGFSHTIEATGTQPVQYLMLRWNAPDLDTGRPLDFRKVDLNAVSRPDLSVERFHARDLLEGPTGCLKKLQLHLSFLAPGPGYDPHEDVHDVVLILLKGTIETLGQAVDAPAVVFCRSGDIHGMSNPASGNARYLAVEFHGSDIPFRELPLIRLGMKLIRALVPRRLRGKIRRILASRNTRRNSDA